MQWSCRKLAVALPIRKDTVPRARIEAGFSHVAGNVSWPATILHFETKGTDGIGLNLDRHQRRCRVLCRREDIDPGLGPAGSGSGIVAGPRRGHGFECGMTGETAGKTASRHISKECTAFLRELLAQCPVRQQAPIAGSPLSAQPKPFCAATAMPTQPIPHPSAEKIPMHPTASALASFRDKPLDVRPLAQQVVVDAGE